jgi:hypothetical protein
MRQSPSVTPAERMHEVMALGIWNSAAGFSQRSEENSETLLQQVKNSGVNPHRFMETISSPGAWDARPRFQRSARLRVRADARAFVDSD